MWDGLEAESLHATWWQGGSCRVTERLFNFLPHVSPSSRMILFRIRWLSLFVFVWYYATVWSVQRVSLCSFSISMCNISKSWKSIDDISRAACLLLNQRILQGRSLFRNADHFLLNHSCQQKLSGDTRG
jgi:hypothetical protein